MTTVARLRSFLRRAIATALPDRRAGYVPARSSAGALVPPQGGSEAQQSDALTLRPGATWTQRLR
eukprot:CAMPEP_0179942062 /NCGR_PEP_ID=MMETSP0983-20121128/17388_1 /TAXON_ID=483367 /ORGANISM="non described non described, Strain CCMP 2436" /LENGTH=64 /DNA_ID=CAMNT_0021849283 /DNA_START=417 /DNA_END=609 /DNA_ORIENTATION=+